MAGLFDDWYDYLNPLEHGKGAYNLGGDLLDKVTGIEAAEGAARSQREGLSEATASQERMFDKSMETQKPWLEAGAGALGQLQEGIGSGRFDMEQREFQAPQFDFEADPGYQFRLDENMRAISAASAKSGGFFSGARGEALGDRASQMASQEYGAAYDRFRDDRNFQYGSFMDDFNRERAGKTDQYNRLASLSGVGQMSAGNVASQQMQQGGNLANLALQSGNIGAQRSMAGYQGGMNLLNTGMQAGSLLTSAFKGGG